MTNSSRNKRRRAIEKRAFDLAIAVPATILLLPVLAVLALLVWVLLGRPIIFTQVRPGFRAEAFTIYKFRSMRNAVGPDGKQLPDAQRLTKFGHFIRAASLDELPELWNVIKGDMSLVGPRPLIFEYVPRYSPEQARRHDVKPGITGLAQIGGRNAISWDEKFALDIQYVDSQSLRLDMSILVRTLRQVLSREGISHSGYATMPEFRGSGRPGEPIE